MKVQANLPDRRTLFDERAQLTQPVRILRRSPGMYPERRQYKLGFPCDLQTALIRRYVHCDSDCQHLMRYDLSERGVQFRGVLIEVDMRVDEHN
jgi:hypothetical protein